MKGLSSKHIALKVNVTGVRTGKYTVCRHVPTSFGLEILHAGAVKGLMCLPLRVDRFEDLLRGRYTRSA